MFENIDNSWTLFLDRDGVINKRTPGKYIKVWEDFEFEDGALDAIVAVSSIFRRIVVVTNQAGLQKRLMTEDALIEIHEKLISLVTSKGGKLDKIYYCPHKAFSKCGCRKPATGMGIQAKEDFPTIDFSKSIMVGDSLSDMEFAKKLGMGMVLVEGKEEEFEVQMQASVDFRAKNLSHFVAFLNKKGFVSH